MNLHLHIIGVLLLILSAAHIVFPTYFKWKKELSTLSLINKEMMIVHTFFIALFVALNGLLNLKASYELIYTSLGTKLCWGLALFWFCRLVVQFFGYSSVLWKGKKLETIIHICFALLWSYITIVYTLIAIGYS